MKSYKGHIVDVIRREVFDGELVVDNGRIVEVKRCELSDNGKEWPYLMPGFIDSHVHIESSMMAPCEFARVAASHGTIGVVADQIGSPTYAKDLAKAILKALPKAGEFRGEIFHYTDEGTCSWFEFAAATMAYAGLGCNVKPIATSEYPTPAKRPAYSVLEKSKIRDTFQVETPWWSDSLKDCLRRL